MSLLKTEWVLGVGVSAAFVTEAPASPSGRVAPVEMVGITHTQVALGGIYISSLRRFRLMCPYSFVEMPHQPIIPKQEGQGV